MPITWRCAARITILCCTHRFRPTGSRAREIFDAVEDMRCQSLGGNVLAGVAQNLTAALDEQLTRKTGATPFRPASGADGAGPRVAACANG